MTTKPQRVGGVLARVQEMAERAKTKAAAAEPPVLPMPQQQPAQATIAPPVWGEHVRGVPNCVLRSALFGAIRRGRRSFLQRDAVASVDGITIRYTGPRLDQADLDVWEQCLHLARGMQPIGDKIPVRVSTYAFLRSIGRSTGGRDVEWLKSAFARLSTALVELEDGPVAWSGQLLFGGFRHDELGEHLVAVNAQMAVLYGRDSWTRIEWGQRMELRGRPLAQWVHGFYSTHAAPYPYRIETIHRLCGSESNTPRSFRNELRGALELVCSVTGWSAQITRDGLVVVDRTPRIGGLTG